MSMRQRSSKSKVWMEDYKQLIIDMKVGLEKLSSENQQLKISLQQCSIKQEQAQTKIEQLSKQLKSLKHKNEILEKQIQSQNEEMKRQIREQKGVTDQLINQNNELKTKTNTLSNSNNDLSSQVKAMKIQLNKKNAILIQLKAQIQSQKKRESQEELQSQTKIRHLKEINDFVKQIFGRIEKDYSSFLKNQQNLIIQSPPMRKSISKSKAEQSTLYKSNYRVSPFKATHKHEKTQNMHEHLRNIKRQIVQQYHKIQNISESVLHKKVDRTLTVIENILSQMSEKVEGQESDFSA